MKRLLAFDPLVLWTALVFAVCQMIIGGILTWRGEIDAGAVCIFRSLVLLLLGGIWQQVYHPSETKQ